MKRLLPALIIINAFGWIALASEPALPAESSQTATTELQNWIAGNAVTVRTLDAADEDFGDLEPLVKAIGPAQVVQLGEPGHGAGSSFAAKVRLVKFLHQRMGFDVLVWESGMYDLELSQAGMRGSDTPAVAARRGVFRIWSDAEELKPLFDYVKTSQATNCPLDMAGFDMQVTADGSVDHFASDLRAFILALKEPKLRRELTGFADQAIAARARLFSSNFADEAELKTLNEAAGHLLAGMRDNNKSFREIRDARSIASMEHWIDNMRVDAKNRYEAVHSIGPEAARENRRDTRNFENLRWLIKEGYPGRKFIIWAHNAHVMNAYYSSDFRTVHVEPKAGDMKPMGVFLTKWLGSRVYTIGMTTYQGNDTLVTGGPATVITPPAAHSLEGRLHALGQPFVFLDLRSGSGPVRAPLSVRIPKYEIVTVPDLGRVYDGIFYIDQMAAATKLN